MPIFRDHFFLSMVITLSGWIIGMWLFYSISKSPKWAKKVFGGLFDKMWGV